MPRRPKSSTKSGNDSTTAANRAANLEFAADHVEPQAPVSDPSGGPGSSIQAASPEQPPRSFGQSSQAAHNLLGALAHDLQASFAFARARAKTAVSYLRTKLTASMPPQTPSTVHELGKWFATALVKMRGSIRGLRTKPLENRRHASLQTGWWKISIALTFLSGLLLAGSVLVWALKDVPWGEIRDGTLKPVVILETADGEPLVRQGPYQGPYAQYNQFPPRLIDAVLSIEDRRFMDHFGIDVRGIGRALLRNFEAGSVVEGCLLYTSPSPRD